MNSQKLEKRLFGTNGVRGVVGSEMSPDLVLRIGAALGTMRKGRIAVGRDTRTSGEALVHAVKAGLLMSGCDVINTGILPTPALQYLVKRHFDGGAMITASHNPPEYNGVKIIESDGTEMADEETIQLESMIFEGGCSVAAWQEVGSETRSTHLVQEYIDGIVGLFPPGIGNGMKVVVDPGFGPAALTTPVILEKLGCTVYTINATMDGTFPGRMPEPTAEGLKHLSAMVKSTGSAFGVAHDGDADRAVFVDDSGSYIEENLEFALIADHICGKRKGGMVLTPVSTSRLVEDVAAKHGCVVEYTPVGSIYVARRMLALLEKGERVVLGGEGNGGLIYPEHQFCRDGGMTAAVMVALLAREGRNLTACLDNLPRYYLIKDKIATDRAAELIGHLDAIYQDEHIDHTDGLKIVREDGWALVRASGTEPLIRIMVESTDRSGGESFYRDILDKIEEVREAAQVLK